MKSNPHFNREEFVLVKNPLAKLRYTFILGVVLLVLGLSFLGSSVALAVVGVTSWWFIAAMGALCFVCGVMAAPVSALRDLRSETCDLAGTATEKMTQYVSDDYIGRYFHSIQVSGRKF